MVINLAAFFYHMFIIMKGLTDSGHNQYFCHIAVNLFFVIL